MAYNKLAATAAKTPTATPTEPAPAWEDLLEAELREEALLEEEVAEVTGALVTFVLDIREEVELEICEKFKPEATAITPLYTLKPVTVAADFREIEAKAAERELCLMATLEAEAALNRSREL